jgi:hypothetical protein
VEDVIPYAIIRVFVLDEDNSRGKTAAEDKKNKDASRLSNATEHGHRSQYEATHHDIQKQNHPSPRTPKISSAADTTIGRSPRRQHQYIFTDDI